MAQKVVLIDDLDGSEATRTVRFSYEGTEYEIDLSEANARPLHLGRPDDRTGGKKVVLALLTWNTCSVSLESVHAYVNEARILQCLGQTQARPPFLCVCDNGSTDGTADALRALELQINIQHKFILNHENQGMPIARNQIIDYMLECDADYLLLMDGDIEIVPFSSFAMLRHMENNGHGLGCIGADSEGMTSLREQESTHMYSIDGRRLDTTNSVGLN